MIDILESISSNKKELDAFQIAMASEKGAKTSDHTMNAESRGNAMIATMITQLLANKF